jgi:hypothetical protein
VVELKDTDLSASLRNISASGLACTATRSIPEMTVVEMTVPLPALPKEEVAFYPFKCKGAVVRCEPISRGNSRRKWLIAIYFTEIDEANQKVLERYIHHRS